MSREVIVLGAGAAGLMCAMEAAKRGRSVLVLDHAERTGSKIRISGGGRCNFTNLHVGPDKYLSSNPHFCKSALSRFTPDDFLKLLGRHGIGYHEKKAGQLFCDESSLQIVHLLEKECRQAGVQILLNCRIAEIEKSDLFNLSTSLGNFRTQSLVMATGGLAMPQVGVSNFGYEVARRFGHRIRPLKPALTPLRFTARDAESFTGLSGLSVDVAVACNGTRFDESMLFTHQGISGPAILQVSSHWSPGETIEVDLLPGTKMAELFAENRGRKLKIPSLLGKYLPHRLAERWCEIQGFTERIGHYSQKELEKLAHLLHHWHIAPAMAEGFNKAEVTLGGVETNELSSKTMESIKVPGLFFIGEVVDVTGQLGGYNLHWAWASGHAAGQYV